MPASKQKTISQRLIANVILFSTAVALFTTGIQLYAEILNPEGLLTNSGSAEFQLVDANENLAISPILISDATIISRCIPKEINGITDIQHDADKYIFILLRLS